MFDENKAFGTTDVSCDKCSYEEQIEGFDDCCLSFSDVAKEIKEMGWKIKYENGDFLHLCPSCGEK